MEETGKVIGRPSEYLNLVDSLESYLADARVDPSLSLSISGVCRAKSLAKSTLYNHQHKPEVAEKLREIRVLAKARRLAARHVSGLRNADASDDSPAPSEEALGVANAAGQSDSQSAIVDLELLAGRVAGTVRRAIWSMSRFSGRHRKHRYVSDLPRVVYDLDVVLRELHRIREELSALSDEWKEGSCDDVEIVSTDDQFSLIGIYDTR